MNRIFVTLIVLFLFISLAQAQPDRWQQRVKYNINVQMNVATNQFSGVEKISYTNNSPDTLNRLFFHTYWNAFQPNSMMDVRSRELGKTVLGTTASGQEVRDWDSRVKDRISKLQPDEIGYQHVTSILINNQPQQLVDHETILEVKLNKPILPHTTTNMTVAFEAQVPVQIRRSGRDNAEGIRYSMSQWYPKIAEYDYQGWNANPYIAREFYGVWGDYDVNITIDKNYLLAATGTLQNANEIGYGYQNGAAPAKIAPVQTTDPTLTWRFVAQNVHDFVWAADTAFTMIKKQTANGNGPLLYIVYKKVDSLESKWQQMADTVQLVYPYIAKTFGPYPYKNYSFIQGGDGGMEYPMATLIKSPSIGTALHEWMHSWYQGMMGSNESLYPWMDEGFATYAELRISGNMRNSPDFWFANAYKSYYRLVQSGREEPMTTHADFYNTNYAYGQAAYSKGCVFLEQLGYIVGQQALDKLLLAYYNTWRFKHPNPNDFIRIAEKESNMELQWYKENWVYTTKTIDYALGNANTDSNGNAVITLKRIGEIPMPVDVLITYRDGSRELHYVPLSLMYGAKKAEDSTAFVVHPEWKWTHPEYALPITHKVQDIKEIEIDPSQRLADINRVNNKIVIP
ncbi:M1 family metallopeptidase [Ilyomonas limi]|uniref:M1 family metallopeptidase n=1 Tax=Ilyomonas limi TaxID=2575867 RepID=A0A4U3KUK2_9BACT|nr:M1 family metallopeptidase [Ilyomonas limi]TKK66111.1 M1 family metallopeptidase [Ilyomonas limi]